MRNRKKEKGVGTQLGNDAAQCSAVQADAGRERERRASKLGGNERQKAGGSARQG